MADKPTKKPWWAVYDPDGGTTPNDDYDVNDSTSGQPNVSEPSISQRQPGWLFQQFPPRQWFNWFWRLVYRWIDWFDQEVSVFTRFKTGPDGSPAWNVEFLRAGAGETGPGGLGRLYWLDLGGMVVMHFIPSINSAGPTQTLNISNSDGNWPSGLLPGIQHYIHCFVRNNSTTEAGILLIPISVSSPMIVTRANGSPFSTSGLKGMERLTIIIPN